MLYRNSTQYAIRALTRMAGMEHGACHRIADIAEAENIPRAYLSQIFKRLVDGKILRSLKGPSGGYVFARPPEKINLFDIKLCIDGPDDFDKCVVGLDLCADQTPCPAHESWKKLKLQTQQSMCRVTLAKASAAVSKKQAKRFQEKIGRPSASAARSRSAKQSAE